MNNTSPNGILGITFKDLEFYGTNHFIHNHGPSIRVKNSYSYLIDKIIVIICRQQIQLLKYMVM